MQCANCGHELTPGGIFCGNCGAKLIASPQSQSQVPPPQQSEQQGSLSPQPTPGPVATVPESSPIPQPQASMGPVAAVPPPAAETLPINTTQPYPSPAQAPAPHDYSQPHAYAVPKQENKGLSIAGMILGITSLVLFWFPFLGTILSVLALIFGFIGIGKGAKGMAIAGLITGGLGFVISIVFLVYIIAVTPDFTDNPVSSQPTSGSDLRFSPE